MQEVIIRKALCEINCLRKKLNLFYSRHLAQGVGGKLGRSHVASSDLGGHGFPCGSHVASKGRGWPRGPRSRLWGYGRPCGFADGLGICGWPCGFIRDSGGPMWPLGVAVDLGG